MLSCIGQTKKAFTISTQERYPKIFGNFPELLFFFQLDHDNFNGFISGVDVGMHRVGRVCGKPVGFAGFPDVRLCGAVLFDNLQGAAGERDDNTRVFMTMHGERSTRKDDGFPHLDVVIFQQRDALGLRGLLGTDGEEDSRSEERAKKKRFHERLPAGDGSTKTQQTPHFEIDGLTEMSSGRSGLLPHHGRACSLRSCGWFARVVVRLEENRLENMGL
jgi:hypothetical protein